MNEPKLEPIVSWNKKLSVTGFIDCHQSNFYGWDTLNLELPWLHVHIPHTGNSNGDAQKYHLINVWVDDHVRDFFYCECNTYLMNSWVALYCFRRLADLMMVKAKVGGFILTSPIEGQLSGPGKNYYCLSQIE